MSSTESFFKDGIKTQRICFLKMIWNWYEEIIYSPCKHNEGSWYISDILSTSFGMQKTIKIIKKAEIFLQYIRHSLDTWIFNKRTEKGENLVNL
jgi:hypothetical protein